MGERETLLRKIVESVIELQEIVVEQQRFGQIDDTTMDSLKSHTKTLKELGMKI